MATKPNLNVLNWCDCLDFPTYELIKSVLAHTTQLMWTLQPETRDCMRDSYTTIVWALRPHLINNDMYSNTFFPSVASIRGFKCFHLFVFKYSSFDRLTCMRCNSNVPSAYEDYIKSVGAPNKTVTRNIQVLTGKIRPTSIVDTPLRLVSLYPNTNIINILNIYVGFSNI